MSFTVLFVCTGNICRSPAAERLFQGRLGLAVQVSASSAGTKGMTGHPIDGPSAVALQELGIDPEGHIARRLDGEMLRTADLVLTASTEHRAAVLRTEPSMISKTFTLREFGRLAADSLDAWPAFTDEELRTRVAAVARQRGLAGPAGPAENDIADPYGASLETARATVAQISRAVDLALAGLGVPVV